MVFSSIGFIFIFFPLFLLVYYELPYRLRNTWLLVGSILFYAFGSFKHPLHILLFVLSLFFNYFMGRAIEMYDDKLGIIMGTSVNLLYLGCFKYLLGILPVGISFYTFQAISYLCDVYYKKCRAEKSFINFGAYLSMFPQLIAGPIIQYPVLCKQLHKRNYHFHNFVQGLQIFILGLGSKVLLANQIGTLWNQLSTIGYESISTPLAWLGIFAYTFQIYFDFWGYSLMAIGIGKTLGFEFPKNFNYPYLAVSMTEFWRKWHITLGNWFREYVYIPLGGNRGSEKKMYRNLFIVWMLTGIWHGANWNFVIWGFFLFIVIALEKAGWKKVLDKHRLLGHLYMLFLIPLSWTLFAHDNWREMICFYKRLFGIEINVTYIYKGDYIKYAKEYKVCFLLCFLFTSKIPKKLWKMLKGTYIGQIILIGIFIGSVYCLYIGLDNPFLYYQF